MKGLVERSDVIFMHDPNTVFNYGVQIIYKFKQSKSELEMGAYILNRSFNVEYLIR